MNKVLVLLLLFAMVSGASLKEKLSHPAMHGGQGHDNEEKEAHFLSQEPAEEGDEAERDSMDADEDWDDYEYEYQYYEDEPQDISQ